MIGKTVHHPVHGVGMVQARRRSGVEYLVHFEGSELRWVRFDQLSLTPVSASASPDLHAPQAGPAALLPSSRVVLPASLRAAEVEPALVVPPPRVQGPTVLPGAPPRSTDQAAGTEIGSMPARWLRARPANFTERKVVESLRLGIVPDEGLHLFTLGREAEIRDLRAWLSRPNDPVRLLVGTYGTGKTHLLRYFRQLALSAGYAVSLVEMDPLETPFSQPKRVYSQIVRHLKWLEAGIEVGFRQLLERGLKVGLLDDHRYFRCLLDTTTDGLWQWIDGSDARNRPPFSAVGRTVPALYRHATAANVYCYLLSGLGWLCRSRELALKGLLVLFDESETLYATRGYQAMERSVNFIDTLIITARDDPEMLQPAWQTSYIHSRHADDVPFLYRQPSGLKLLFAFAANDQLNVSTKLASQAFLDLLPLGANAMSTILAQVQALYQRAYDAKGGDGIDLDAWGEILAERGLDTTRAMVKSAVEALDIVRFGTYAPEDDD